MEERRRQSDELIAVMNSKLDMIILRQDEIKTQVEKTNGRVTVLERFMHIVIGGGIVFGAVNLPTLTKLLVK